MEHQKLSVMIISRMGAHQKALQALCASIPQITLVGTASNYQQAIEMIANQIPDVLILGANLAMNWMCELLAQINTMDKPPYCIALTLSDSKICFDQKPEPDKVISTGSFAVRLPEILDEVYAR